MNKNIRNIRVSKGITNEDMSKMLGISKGSYSKKENGSIKFSLSEAKKISEMFNMTIEEIFFGNIL